MRIGCKRRWRKEAIEELYRAPETGRQGSWLSCPSSRLVSLVVAGTDTPKLRENVFRLIDRPDGMNNEWLFE